MVGGLRLLTGYLQFGRPLRDELLKMVPVLHQLVLGNPACRDILHCDQYLPIVKPDRGETDDLLRPVRTGDPVLIGPVLAGGEPLHHLEPRPYHLVPVPAVGIGLSEPRSAVGNIAQGIAEHLRELRVYIPVRPVPGDHYHAERGILGQGQFPVLFPQQGFVRLDSLQDLFLHPGRARLNAHAQHEVVQQDKAGDRYHREHDPLDPARVVFPNRNAGPTPQRVIVR
ncbi:MAG: hypothetical protein A4E60_03529 [Syntrophorhabdus sp. PtaB.Bin047]|nr:MAG: hypothetical protein A4E60_03529 [Syntrophorhabdus sp. PtaB.Bin047]